MIVSSLFELGGKANTPSVGALVHLATSFSVFSKIPCPEIDLQ